MRRVHYYINFYFKKILYDDDFYSGEFSCPDLDVYCEFMYDRRKETCQIWNNSHPVEEILPLAIWWLDKKLEENGELRENESKISY